MSRSPRPLGLGAAVLTRRCCRSLKPLYAVWVGGVCVDMSFTKFACPLFGPSCASFAADKEGEIVILSFLSIEGEMMKST